MLKHCKWALRLAKHSWMQSGNIEQRCISIDLAILFHRIHPT